MTKNKDTYVRCKKCKTRWDTYYFIACPKCADRDKQAAVDAAIGRAKGDGT